MSSTNSINSLPVNPEPFSLLPPSPAIRVAKTRQLVVLITLFEPSFNPNLVRVCKAFRDSLSDARQRTLNTQYPPLKTKVQTLQITLNELISVKSHTVREFANLESFLNVGPVYFPEAPGDLLVQLGIERRRNAREESRRKKELSSKLDTLNQDIKAQTKELDSTKVKLQQMERFLFPKISHQPSADAWITNFLFLRFL